MNDIATGAEALTPPALVAVDGSLRRVGVEVEFLGPSPRVVAEALVHDLHGTREAEDPHAFRIRCARFGDMMIETDLRHVHPRRHPELGLRLDGRIAAWLGTVASPFAPRELITAPMLIAQLPEVDAIVASLRAAGARPCSGMHSDSTSTLIRRVSTRQQ